MKKDLLLIAIVFSFVSLAFFIYAKFSHLGLMSIYKSWDGPSYVIAAESLYVPELAVQYNTIQSPEIRADFTFLPAHFPLYPLLIRTFAFIGYYQAAVLISVIFSLAFILAFYFFARQLRLSHPLLLTLPLILLPPRWFIISHTGSSEPLFLFFVMTSLIYYFRRSPWASAVMASFAMLARPQGALLGLAYLGIASIHLLRSGDLKFIIKSYLPYILIPLTLIGIFLFYQQQTGDFWAFFKAISIFHHFKFSLFPTFNFGAPNIETFWQETNAIYYFVYLLAILDLFFRSKKWQLGVLGIFFYVPLLFLQHTDISRYSLPLVPIAFIAFAPVIAHRTFTWASLLLLPATFLYSANFILYNRAP
jgi:hypothetical protein